MHNLPVLWLAVGLLSPCHAPFPIVSQLRVALLLCVVHAVQCAVSVPGLWSRQQWQLVWSGPSLAIQVGVASHATKAAGNKKVLASLSVHFSVSVLSLSPLRLKGSASKQWRVGRKIMEVMRGRQSRDQTCCLVQPLCNELTSSKLTSQHAENVFGLFIFLFFLPLSVALLCWEPWCFAIWHAFVAAGLILLI